MKLCQLYATHLGEEGFLDEVLELCEHLVVP